MATALNLLLLLLCLVPASASTQHGAPWFQCADIILLPPSPPAPTSSLFTSTESHRSKHPVIEVWTSNDDFSVEMREDGRLFCRCLDKHATLQTVELNLELSYGMDKFSASTHLSLPCHPNITAICQEDAASAILVSSLTRASLSPSAGSGYKADHGLADSKALFSLSEEEGGEVRKLLVDSAQLMGGTDAQDNSIYSSCVHDMELRTTFPARSLHHKDEILHIVLLQSIPFDRCSCVKSEPSSRVVISLLRLTDPAMQLGWSHNIHAHSSNEIHGAGGEFDSAQRRSGLQAVDDHHHRREIREASSSLQQLRQFGGTVCIRENVPVGTAVAVAQFGGSGSTDGAVQYSISASKFAINSSTGVIKTSSKSQITYITGRAA